MRPKIVYNRHEIDSTETKRGSLGPCVGSRKGDEKKNHMDNWEREFNHYFNDRLATKLSKLPL